MSENLDTPTGLACICCSSFGNLPTPPGRPFGYVTGWDIAQMCRRCRYAAFGNGTVADHPHECRVIRP